MTPPVEPHAAQARALRFIALLLAGSLLLGAAIRARIWFASVLPPDEPFLWLLAGALQDFAITTMMAALAMLLARVLPRTSAILFALYVFAVTIVHFGFSEATVFFGHTIRPEDLQTQLHPRIFIGSAQGKLLMTFVGVVLVYWIFVLVLRAAAMRARRPAPRLLTLSALALASAGASFAFAGRVHQLETTAHPFVQIAGLMAGNPFEQFGGTVTIPEPGIPATRVRELAANDGRHWVDDERPLTHVPPKSGRRVTIPAGVKPNIVFFLMEGIRAEEVGSYGASIEGVTPNIDAWAARGIRFEQPYSSGSFTPEGELAMWYGLLPSPYELVVRTRPEIALTGLPEILGANGWKSFLWIHPGDQTLYLSSRFYKSRGFRLVDGRDFPANEPRTNWGHSDKALARRAVELMNRAAEPFATMVLTVSNHHPYQVPEDGTSTYRLPRELRGNRRLSVGSQVLGVRTGEMLQTVHYTDESFGYFMELASKEPWFARTIFVITGDHGTSVTPLRDVSSMRDVFELRHRVPLIVYSPMLETAMTIPGPTSHVDVLPTLLGILGIEGPRVGLGADVLAEGPPPERPIIAWSSIAAMVNVVKRGHSYHASVDVSKSPAAFSEESLFPLEGTPRAEDNLIAVRRELAEELRRDARTFIELYPWLLAEGRFTARGMETTGAR